MSRYIDAELFDISVFYDEKSKELTCGEVKKYIEEAKKYIDKIPTADVVEVTRCKYCKFYKPYDKPSADFDGRCFARNCETDEYDFCNYGVMKKEYEK